MMNPDRHFAGDSLNRRQLLQTLFCSSAALALNLAPRRLSAEDIDHSDTHFLALGDFGSGDVRQKEVATAMRRYVSQQKLSPAGLLLLGDNFYGRMEGGLECTRWETCFEDMYPAQDFPGPCWVVLGNHDYHDNPFGDQVQLEYARTRQTRWTLPNKWHRLDFPAKNPLVTFLFVDTNLPPISGGFSSKLSRFLNSMDKAAEAEQLQWLKTELAKPRAAFTVVVGHHPLYSNGAHGDSRTLINQWGELFQQHGVHAYLCGHDHDLQHLEFAGRKTSFVISGGGGARLRDLKGKHQAKFARKVFGFTHLQVSDQRLIFRHIDSTGAQLHAFTKGLKGSVEIL